MKYSINSSHQLLMAVKKNRYDEVRQSLQSSKYSFKVRDEAGNTAMHWAVLNNNVAMVNLLRMHGAVRALRNNDMFTPLALAVDKKHWGCVDEMAQSKVVNGEGADSALLGAVIERQFRSARKLLKGGAGANARWYPVPYTPLHWAVKHRSAQLIELLLRHGAKQSLKDDEGLTPLALAVKQRDWSLVIVLAKTKADIAEDYAMGLLLAAKANQYQAVKALLAVGAATEIASEENNYSALHWAVVNDNHEMCALLMHHGAEINQKDALGNTPLHLAISGQRVTLVSWFKAMGVDAQICNQDNESAAAMASKLSCPEVVDALYNPKYLPHPAAVWVAQGALEKLTSMHQEGKLDIGTKLKPVGMRVFEYAVQLKQLEVISMLIKLFPKASKAKSSAFQMAVNLGHWQCAELLDKERALVERADKSYLAKLSWRSFSNTNVKKAFINELQSLNDENCDKQRLYQLMAASKTARYRQLKIWSSAPTATTTFFLNKQKQFTIDNKPCAPSLKPVSSKIK